MVWIGEEGFLRVPFAGAGGVSDAASEDGYSHYVTGLIVDTDYDQHRLTGRLHP